MTKTTYTLNEAMAYMAANNEANSFNLNKWFRLIGSGIYELRKWSLYITMSRTIANDVENYEAAYNYDDLGKAYKDFDDYVKAHQLKTDFQDQNNFDDTAKDWENARFELISNDKNTDVDALYEAKIEKTYIYTPKKDGGYKDLRCLCITKDLKNPEFYLDENDLLRIDLEGFDAK